MSWLALMPFPAFTPLNWWALTTPRNAVLASLSTTRLALDAWRAGADGLRAMMRLQQDEMLRALETPLTEASESEAQAEASAESGETAESTAALLVRPMVEATRAYGRVGRAFIVAQRDTLRAFAPPPEQPH